MIKPTNPILSKLDELLIKISETENKLKELKFQLRYIPKIFSDANPTQEERLELAKYLYWLNIGIPKEEISYNLLGIDTKEFNKLLKNNYGNLICEICKNDIVFKSISNFKSFMSDIKRGNKIIECNSCMNKRLELTSLKHDQENNERRLQYQEKINKLKSLPYIEYLQTEHWKELRKKQLYKSNYKCQICNTTSELNVHHRTYERLGEEKYDDLITLCVKCHNLFHNHSNVCLDKS